MEEKKVKSVIRIFEDDSAELLEGKSLQNFISQEQAAHSLLHSRGFIDPKKSKIKWLPLKKVVIER
jgi:hypothetical protein